MALTLAYSQTPSRRAVHTLIVAHYDAHGVSFAAARARILQNRGEIVEVASKFPETGPQGLSSGQLRQYIDTLGVAPQRFEIIDIPIDVRNPDAAIRTLADLSSIAPVYYYDHHETDVPFINRLLAHGITPMIFQNNVALATALELMSDPIAKELAVVGAVADRDTSILSVVDRETIEARYLRLANRMDVVVRNPSQVGFSTLSEIAKALAMEGIALIERINVTYPPEQLARELEARIREEGSIALLVDWFDQPFQHSQWTPKTLEQLLLMRRKYIAVAITPGYNPRTRSQEGWDVRILRYWLAPNDIPVPEQVAKDLIAVKAIQGQVVGHADYISLRYSSLDEARNVARMVFRTVEGMQPQTVHLVNDKYVAEAIRRDFTAILNELKEIHKQMVEMYREYLDLKRRQVELLERASGATRYD